MATIGTICWAFIGPILADGITSPDAGPTWTLAGACAIFLSTLAWSLRSLMVWGRQALIVFYAEIAVPIKEKHVQLIDTMIETRQRDSHSLEELAADMREFRQTVKCRHEP
jgi:hypothetical protein